jgi:hypothetical protein
MVNFAQNGFARSQRFHSFWFAIRLQPDRGFLGLGSVAAVETSICRQ